MTTRVPGSDYQQVFLGQRRRRPADGAQHALDANPAACDYPGVSLDDLKMAHKTDLNFGVDPEIKATIVGQLERSGNGRVSPFGAPKARQICAQVKQAGERRRGDRRSPPAR